MKASLLLKLAVASSFAFSISAYADQFYGPVKKSDTLGQIVKKHFTGERHLSNSLMARIAEDNPSAFIRGDINLLRRGSVLKLPGDQWNLSATASGSEPFLSNLKIPEGVTIVIPDEQTSESLGFDTGTVDATAVGIDQRLRNKVSELEQERASLQEEVSRLAAETQRLNEKIESLRLLNRQSDDQLRILDAEIIRLTKSLIEQSSVPNIGQASAEVGALQQKLRKAGEENEQLTKELSLAKSELEYTQTLKDKADKRMSEVVTQNRVLRAQLQQTQPDKNFYAEQAGGQTLSLLGDLVRMPLWAAILGGSLLSLILIALFTTRKRRYEPEELESTLPVESTASYSTENVVPLGGVPLVDDPDERHITDSVVEEDGNVFQMFDDGSLTMDLKLDMAKAYLKVDDSVNAKALLDEVMNGGSELQRRKASRLISEAA